ncbi:hypothetical protein SETIT_1G183100v2 [Setaria italica]|uniref:Uncharacterized protein n=1 Tax=Setaria italica TaxID=4555 RepID=A0A368PMN8_SETIT|nr:hypothetical protein SETIT_1G183100v2 [Setaria italica]
MVALCALTTFLPTGRGIFVTSSRMLLALVTRVVLPWTRGLGIVHWRTIFTVNLVLLHSVLLQFSPTNEPKAYGAPTVDSVLRTYLPEIHSSPSPACSETTGEATTRVDRMKREVEETAFPILAAQTSVGKKNRWEVDKLPVFVRALEVLRIDVQRHLDAMESSLKEKMQP